MRQIYPLDEVLSVSTGFLVADRSVEALYDLMGFLTEDTGITTLGLAAAVKSCAAELKRQFPELERVTTPWWAGGNGNVSKADIDQWVRDQVHVVGATTFAVEGGTVHSRDYSFMGNMGKGR
jgi:hypothetical protein